LVEVTDVVETAIQGYRFFVLVRELKLKEALATDGHFREVGFIPARSL
jgi:hypothetical protein